MKCDNKKIQEEKRLTLVKDHWVYMSNERTFLAWISNNIGIMALGFVIEKPFFTSSGSNQITSAQGAPDGFDYYALLGIFFVFLGAAAGVCRHKLPAFICARKLDGIQGAVPCKHSNDTTEVVRNKIF